MEYLRTPPRRQARDRFLLSPAPKTVLRFDSNSRSEPNEFRALFAELRVWAAELRSPVPALRAVANEVRSRLIEFRVPLNEVRSSINDLRVPLTEVRLSINEPRVPLNELRSLPNEIRVAPSAIRPQATALFEAGLFHSLPPGAAKSPSSATCVPLAPLFAVMLRR